MHMNLGKKYRGHMKLQGRFVQSSVAVQWSRIVLLMNFAEIALHKKVTLQCIASSTQINIFRIFSEFIQATISDLLKSQAAIQAVQKVGDSSLNRF